MLDSRLGIMGAEEAESVEGATIEPDVRVHQREPS